MYTTSGGIAVNNTDVGVQRRVNREREREKKKKLLCLRKGG